MEVIRSSRTESDELIAQCPADVKHARRVLLLRDGLIGSDSDPERELLGAGGAPVLLELAERGSGLRQYIAQLMRLLPSDGSNRGDVPGNDYIGATCL
jgi:hypothetical protein